ncbi:hypothetical protein GCM10010994_50400 [Chelatococcus reniformis]|uniref:Short-chain dehydrogenase n=2 Tax=Chelatococcus reniformis TaxID=1494448 RepID=A0A916XNQ9_9HYPH|nr:hypothetical protein GCM10010994_50400 [Chelatococcus reniformis]
MVPRAARSNSVGSNSRAQGAIALRWSAEIKACGSLGSGAADTYTRMARRNPGFVGYHGRARPHRFEATRPAGWNEEVPMNIEGSVALVTGANRGLGKAFAEALIGAGAAKVYAGARDPAAITDPRLTPVSLDVTQSVSVAAAAERCGDATILINNAGILLGRPMLAAGSEQAMRQEMEVNVYGVLAMMRAFAPILARNGGGAIANMLSVVSWFTSPLNATYGASKRAALAVTDAARMELKAQGTQVIGIYAGFVDTDMAAGIDRPKTSPRQVAERTLEGIRAGVDHVLADERAEQVRHDTRFKPEAFAAGLQALWDGRAAGVGR